MTPLHYLTPGSRSASLERPGGESTRSSASTRAPSSLPLDPWSFPPTG
ncbi:hypothetical protein [Lacisediminihabitans sp.]